MVLLPDANGNYPLHIAIHNQQSSDVIYRLFKSCPDTGKIRDAENNLLPFMLVALGNWENEKNQLDSCHRILREDPLLIFGE